MYRRPIRLSDIEIEGAHYEQTGLRVVACDADAIRLWRELGGVAFNTDNAFIERVETDRYAPDLPRGTLLLCIDDHCHIDEGDLSFFMGKGAEAALLYVSIGDNGEEVFTPPGAVEALQDLFDIDDNRTYCSILLPGEDGKPSIYLPANRYARAGFESAPPLPTEQGGRAEALKPRLATA